MDESADPKFARDDELREAVLAYMAEHPQAMDTLQGIAGWWIPRHQIRVDVSRLDIVLADLIRTGSLESVDAAGKRMYRLARRQLEEE